MENSNLRSQFLLDPGITYLNFGSFGACAKPVFEDYQQWQRRLETEPVQFIAMNGPANLKTSREALAAYVNCNDDDLELLLYKGRCKICTAAGRASACFQREIYRRFF